LTVAVRVEATVLRDRTDIHFGCTDQAA
jgi:hypothetical protein